MMGQAKQRGTYEQRVAEAVQKRNEEEAKKPLFATHRHTSNAINALMVAAMVGATFTARRRIKR